MAYQLDLARIGVGIRVNEKSSLNRKVDTIKERDVQTNTNRYGMRVPVEILKI
jgi:hypothetical protein